jgi:hypothetical protein
MDVRQTLISLCSPVMNRLDDLRQVMPARIAEANASPPVELCILDCSSIDGLKEYMDELMEVARLVPDNSIKYKRIEGLKYWHMAKGKNAATLMGHGGYLVTMNADDEPKPGFVDAIRDAAKHGNIWGYVDKLCSTIFYRNVEFVAAGGYDERFELYGPEDRDMQYRLRLLYGYEVVLPNCLLRNIYTPDDKKVANYRVIGTKHSLHKMMNEYYLENTMNGVLVANKGKEWGRWTE